VHVPSSSFFVSFVIRASLSESAPCPFCSETPVCNGTKQFDAMLENIECFYCLQKCFDLEKSGKAKFHFNRLKNNKKNRRKKRLSDFIQIAWFDRGVHGAFISIFCVLHTRLIGSVVLRRLRRIVSPCIKATACFSLSHLESDTNVFYDVQSKG